MEACKYKPVDTKVCKENKDESITFSSEHFLRQLLVCFGLMTSYFVSGLSLGAPTVVIPQFRRDNNTAVSEEMASWLSSALSYSAMPWVIILPAISQRIGRKPPFYLAIITSVISFAVFYFGNTTTHFLISQITQGILFGSNLTISVIIVTEYTSPQYRGIFLAIKSATIWWGMWASNAIGTFFRWNYIGLFGLICSVSYVTIFIWPESPQWLATKGRFDECAKAHRWLKGVDQKSEEELENLVESQKEYLQNFSRPISLKDKVANFTKMVTLKELYMPILLSVLIMAQYHSSGKMVCSIYSIEVIKKITESESTAYTGMLILDGVSVLGMYFGSILSKYLRRRTLLLVSSIIGIAFLFSLSLYISLVKMSYVNEDKIVSIFLLAAFSITISCGPMIMSMSIYAELIPLRFKSLAIIIIISSHFIISATSIKMAPTIFRKFSLQGTFALYGVLASIFTFVLYKYLPETKDKTLQEIEEYFKDKSHKALKKDDDAKELVEFK